MSHLRHNKPRKQNKQAQSVFLLYFKQETLIFSWQSRSSIMLGLCYVLANIQRCLARADENRRRIKKKNISSSPGFWGPPPRPHTRSRRPTCAPSLNGPYWRWRPEVSAEQRPSLQTLWDSVRPQTGRTEQVTKPLVHQPSVSSHL